MSEGSDRQTQFDSQSHRRLYEMIAHANPALLMQKGNALLQASSEINRIARDLKAHIDHVPWEGESGEAFRRWTHHMANESAKLATYTGTAGYWLNQSGQALSEAQTMPRPNYVETEDVATNGITNSPLGLPDPEREEAIRQLTKVASYYRVTQQYVTQQEKPNFVPMDRFAFSDSVLAEQQHTTHPSGSSMHHGTTEARTRGEQTTEPAPPPTATHAHIPNFPASTDLDSLGQVKAPPDTTPSPPIPADTTTTRPGDNPGHGQPAVGNPATNSRPMANPPQSRPSPSQGTATKPRQPAPQTPTSGRRDGIIGGTPLPKSDTPRPSRGVVMGTEPAPSGRVPATGGPAVPPTGSPAGPPQSGSGRRLATEQGGPVHPTLRPGNRPSGDFTPGGSGLVRGGQPSSPTPPVSTANRRASGERPDYLEEDAQTWAQRRRNPVPPVIE